jgi:hypothetical protein
VGREHFEVLDARGVIQSAGRKEAGTGDADLAVEEAVGMSWEADDDGLGGTLLTEHDLRKAGSKIYTGD